MWAFFLRQLQPGGISYGLSLPFGSGWGGFLSLSLTMICGASLSLGGRLLLLSLPFCANTERETLKAITTVSSFCLKLTIIFSASSCFEPGAWEGERRRATARRSNMDAKDHYDFNQANQDDPNNLAVRRSPSLAADRDFAHAFGGARTLWCRTGVWGIGCWVWGFAR